MAKLVDGIAMRMKTLTRRHQQQDDGECDVIRRSDAATGAGGGGGAVPSNYSTLTEEGEYSLDEAIDAIGFGCFQLKLTLFVGLCWMSDAMEIMILSILSPALKCQWRISTVEEALLTVLVFVGQMFGASGWGKFSDKYGRKKSILMCAIYTVFYGFLSAFSPNFIWLLVMRTLVGIGVGGVPQAVTIFSEFLPTKYRFAVAFIQVFWSLGTSAIVLAAVFIMPAYGWRYLVLVAALPCLIFAVSCVWMPESTRYDIAIGNVDGARATLERISRDNGKSLPPGRLALTSVQDSSKRGQIRDLFKPEYRLSTSLLWIIWVVTCFSYYGLVLMSTELYKYADDCSSTVGTPGHSIHKDACALECKELDQSDYLNLLWTSLAEFPGIILCLVLIEVVGRKKAISLQLGIYVIFTFTLCFCLPTSLLTLFLFVARGAVAGGFQALYVYTPEIYATEVRSIGLGTACAAARIGAIVTPFIGQVMLEYSVVLAVCIYAVLALTAAILACFLPIETKGKQLGAR